MLDWMAQQRGTVQNRVGDPGSGATIYEQTNR